ncbi:MAG TPA: lipid II flippase MurJ [Alphaproteobacteria bacterium]|nr:lipid II flippase MurJ [Alphaproteobacteria bacterium]
MAGPSPAGLKVVVAAFYALRDTRTPVRIGLYTVLLHLGLSALLIIPRQHGGLALVTSLAAYFNLVGLLMRLRQHLGPMQGCSVRRSALKALGGSVIIAMLTGRWGGSAAADLHLKGRCGRSPLGASCWKASFVIAG